MCGKVCSISFYILLVTFFLQQSQVHGSSNNGRKLDCYPFKLEHENFQVDFYFSSRKKRNQLYEPTTSFRSGNIDFDPRRRTTVLIHGFLGTSQDQYMQSLSDHLISWKDSNVINVEWRAGCSNLLSYFQAAVNTEYAAARIRWLFKTIKNRWRNVKDWGPIHFIGHSLGAHLAGQAANFMRSQDNLIVYRVTGLDPAGPCFDHVDMPLRLKRTDAKFVDVIHTDASTALEHRFGLRDAIGHADFFVNGGVRQPGCNTGRRKRTLEVIDWALHALNDGLCHHNRALELFTETVKQASWNGCRFWARRWRLDSPPEETTSMLQKPCASGYCVEMGINAEKYRFRLKSKIYYAPTTSHPPYCKLN